MAGWWSYHHIARLGTVIDGDTITAMYQLKPVKIRLSAVNAPELYDYGHHVKQTCGQESKDELVKLLNTKWLYVQRDGDDKDRYGRFIRAVFTAKLIDVQEELINDGWAVPQYHSSRGAVYHELHQAAMEAKRGWFDRENNCKPLIAEGPKVD
ncbi:MAG: thermonuclease family protein [bacterium]|nr:thermonuclease family protein [bacterium]